MSENQDSGEIMRGTDDLNEVSAEDVPEVRCAETEILKDAESPLRDRDDSEVLTNQYDESLLVNISDEEEMDFESVDEIQLRRRYFFLQVLVEIWFSSGSI